MTVKPDQAPFTVPLTETFHKAAQRAYQPHSEPQKRKQVYLNALSVQAVQFYLTCLGIKTHPAKSESWHPVSQVLADTADLWVSDLGRLECRPVLPASSTWAVPSEVWTDRIGYLFIQVNTDLTEATLLGFLPKIQTEIVTLEQLQPLETFPAYLDKLHPQAAALSARVTLQQWLIQAVDAGWTNLDTLMAEWQAQELAFSFRIPLTRTDLIKPAEVGMKQGKFLALGSEARVLLIVGIAPAPSSGLSSGPSSAQASSAFNITVELYPTGNQAYLPPTLQLVVMDETNTPVLQAEGRQSEGLEFQFSGGSGESFSIQISLDQLTLTELFEI
ncbi:MAG: DUF1822 family protein [Cyanobacteria bacterium P01_A01_bin.114]